VEDGSLAEAVVDAAATRVVALRIAAARVTRPPLSVINSPAHRALAAEARAAAAGQ
jgi:hypothetical protein